MRIVNIFFTLLFLLFTYLQLNDPDPYVWVPLYLLGAVTCFLSLKKGNYTFLYLTGIFIYSAYAVFLFFETNGVYSWWRDHNAEGITGSMEDSRPWIEETREFFGLLILIAVFLLNLLTRRYRHTAKITK